MADKSFVHMSAMQGFREKGFQKMRCSPLEENAVPGMAVTVISAARCFQAIRQRIGR